jgi:site-specific DNA recombinase
VVVSALDRFGRKLIERVRSREELKALGVATHSVREGGEVTDVVANILAVVAQEEVERLSRRISDVKQHFRGGGWYPVGRCPWGYRLRPATASERAAGAPKSVLEIGQATAEYVRESFRRVADGASVRAVVAWLAGLPSSAQGHRRLSYSAVRQIVSSPIYVGRISEVADAPLARWPAIVDEMTFWRVQDRVASHSMMPRQATQRYLMTGLLRCHRCGARMAGWQRRDRPAYPKRHCPDKPRERGDLHDQDRDCTSTVDSCRTAAAVDST